MVTGVVRKDTDALVGAGLEASGAEGKGERAGFGDAVVVRDGKIEFIMRAIIASRVGKAEKGDKKDNDWEFHMDKKVS